MFDSIVIHGVTSARYHSQFHLWPCTMQVIRCDYRTDIIQSALHSYAWDVLDLVYALQSKHQSKLHGECHEHLGMVGLSSATCAAAQAPTRGMEGQEGPAHISVPDL